MVPAVATYESRDPSNMVLYQVIAEHLETFLASLDDDPAAKGLPTYVQREFSTIYAVASWRMASSGMRCASANGFSLHANTDVAAHRRDQLERLPRYTARGAVSLERLTKNASGDLLYRFTWPLSDGICGIELSPLELIEKLAALVSPPRAHLLHYSGCLAPNSKLRVQLSPPRVSVVRAVRKRRRRHLTGVGRAC